MLETVLVAVMAIAAALVIGLGVVLYLSTQVLEGYNETQESEKTESPGSSDRPSQ